MISNYRKIETIEACQWNTNNKEELKEFCQEIDFIYFTNKPPIPVLHSGSNDIKMEIGDFIFKFTEYNPNGSCYKIMPKSEFEKIYERT